MITILLFNILFLAVGWLGGRHISPLLRIGWPDVRWPKYL